MRNGQHGGRIIKTQQETGAESVARAIIELGVTKIFSLCGDHINALLYALSRADIQIIGVRHEAAAIHMADGWARATGLPGVVVVTGGPGYANAIPGLAMAHSAGTPVVLISGQSPIDQRERGGWQSLYQAEIARPVTKWAQEVHNPDHLREFIARAFRIAMSGIPGPVSISIPVDVFAATLTCSLTEEQQLYPILPMSSRTEFVAASRGDPVSDASALLATAKRPAAVLGSCALWDIDPGTASSLVRRLGVPVFTVDLARGLVPDDGEYCFGYGDPYLNRTFRELLKVDVLMLVGASIDGHISFGLPRLLPINTKIVQLHREASQIGLCRSSDAVVLGPLKEALEQLCLNKETQNPVNAEQSKWLRWMRNKHAENRKEWTEILRESRKDKTTIHPIEVCFSLARHKTPRTAMIFDVGDFIHWPRMFFGADTWGHWLDGVRVGAIGPGLPLGIGAQVAYPEDPVWIFMGDGGFSVHGWEISTAAQFGLPIKVIVGNDSCWGIEKRLQLQAFQDTVAVDLPDVRLDQFAEVLGAKGIRVEHHQDLNPAVDELVAADRPCVLDVKIRPLCGRPLLDFERI